MDGLDRASYQTNHPQFPPHPPIPIQQQQRRRVQLFLGLVRPFEILLLDEVTVSLDVVVRQDLLRWLRRETEVRTHAS